MPFDDRNKIIFGEKGSEILRNSKICIYGLGGVGASAAMDLVRAGIENFFVADFDTISESNLNRLYFAYLPDCGKAKTEVFINYAKKINPNVNITGITKIIHGKEAENNIPNNCDFYIDCIDSLNPKVNLIIELAKKELPFISAMGTAGRLAPERLRISSIWESTGCPLASEVRNRLRRRGFSAIGKVQAEIGKYGVSIPNNFISVWSDEPAVKPILPENGLTPGVCINGVRVRAVQGSAPFVPQAAGHLLASYVVRNLLKQK